MKEFDPYHAWLGIPPKEQPPHHYRLLNIELFEPEPEVIENAVERLKSHVKRYQSGENGAAAQKLLSELAQAGDCLLDPPAKAKYDAALRAKLKPTKPAALPQAKAAPPQAEVALAAPAPVAPSPPAPVPRTQPAVSKRAEKASQPFRIPMLVWVAAGIGFILVAAFAQSLWKKPAQPIENQAVTAANKTPEKPPSLSPIKVQSPKDKRPIASPPPEKATPTPVKRTEVLPTPADPPTSPTLPMGGNEQLAQAQATYQKQEDAFILEVVSRYEAQIAAAQEAGNDAERERWKAVRFNYIANKVTPSDLPADMLESLSPRSSRPRRPTICRKCGRCTAA
jgi:hypothetical protein